MNGAADAPGELAIVLHTHMPYVEGFGTWPFGEEWLFEAMATCYLPLLDVLERSGSVLTLSLTPVLGDQLSAAGVGERFRTFITDVRRVTHAKDVEGLRSTGMEELAAEVERAGEDYERALRIFDALGGDLLGALERHATWTSAATHAVLPMCVTDAGARMQIDAGLAAHRARAASKWRGGFWLPECAYAPWVGELLAEAGVRATCVDLTDVFGYGDERQLAPLRAADGGPVLVPIDRATIELVWSDDGYPAHGRYRDYHRHTVHHHRPWSNDGEPYVFEEALALARRDAADFVARVRERVAGGGLAVCAIDTELLGHWWYEGVAWLVAVLDEAEAQGLGLVSVDDAVERGAVGVGGAELGVSTWGTPRDLSTWDGPQVAELAFAARAAELAVLAAGEAAGPVAARELCALQASDWAFMVTRGLAADYPLQRFAGHRDALNASLLHIGSGEDDVRNIAPYASVSSLFAP